MKSIGNVVAILNERLILVRLNEAFTAGTELTVFSRTSSDQIQATTGLPHLDVPKGQVRILSHQNEDLYLAERFREPGEKRRRFVAPASNLLATILTPQEEITEVPGPWSAQFDQANSLKITFDGRVQVGDLIALS